MIKFCPNCNKECESIIDVREETYHIVDEDITLPKVSVVVCKECGNDIWDDDVDDSTLIRAYHQYNQTHLDDPITSVFTGKAW